MLTRTRPRAGRHHVRREYGVGVGDGSGTHDVPVVVVGEEHVMVGGALQNEGGGTYVGGWHAPVAS